MKIETSEADSYPGVSRELRAATWDIAETWFSETRVGPDRLINELPTLLGGIAKIIDDPTVLADLEPGGDLHTAAAEFGRFRQEAGFEIDRLMADFSLLRYKLWRFCEQFANSRAEEIYELERRLNSSIDAIASVAVDAFWKQATADLVEFAVRDNLTGFLQARVFDERLVCELSKAKRYRYPLVVMRIDVDDFRAYNELEGRLAGNRLLHRAALEIHAEIRASDEGVRLGADEFGILLPQTRIEDAKGVGERIRRRIRQIPRGENRLTTVSIGAAVFPDAADRETLMAAADETLKAARRDGGDLVRV